MVRPPRRPVLASFRVGEAVLPEAVRASPTRSPRAERRRRLLRALLRAPARARSLTHRPLRAPPLQPYESFPPFAIIVGAITAMGGVQYLVHHAFEGKPKAVGADNFDRLLKYRDERLKDEAKVRRAMDRKETLR